MKTIRFDVISESGYYAFEDFDGEIFHLVEYHIPLDNNEYREGFAWAGTDRGFLTDINNHPFSCPLCAVAAAIDRMADEEKDPVEIYKFDTAMEMHRWIVRKLSEKSTTNKKDDK